MSQRFQSDGGFSLIELVIAMTILGIGSISVMAAIGTSVISSGVHRNYATAETVTRDYAEAINLKASTLSTYDVCPTAAQLTPTFTSPKNSANVALYTVAIEAPPSTWASDSTQAVQYWIPDSTGFPNGTFQNRSACTSFSGNACSAESRVTASCDPGLQRVWVHVKTNPSLLGAGTKDVDSVDQYSRILVRRYDAQVS
jgi:prepilin-type N-terminal cleavage/methylation domain-containing protein